MIDCPIECPLFRISYVQQVLWSEKICSEGPMFRWSYIQKVIILCSEEGPMFRNISLECPIFRDLMFRRSFVQKVACCNTFSSNSSTFRYKNIFISFIIFITLRYSILLGIHAYELRSSDVSKLFGTSNSEVPKLGNPKSSSYVPKLRRHAWRFALRLFCD